MIMQRGAYHAYYIKGAGTWKVKIVKGTFKLTLLIYYKKE